jgi:hypothetical protein
MLDDFLELSMSRMILVETQIHPAIRRKVASHHQDFVQQVVKAISSNDVVVVRMGFNPFSA